MRKIGSEGDELFPFMLAILQDSVVDCAGLSFSSPSLGVDYWYEVKPSVAGVCALTLGWWRWGGAERKGGPERRAEGAVPFSYWCILFLMVLQVISEPVSHQ